MAVNPGSIASQMPPQEDDIQRRLRDLERMMREFSSAKSGQAMGIGAGGITIDGGGSLTITGTGSLNVGSGALNSAGSIAAGTFITAGTTIAAGGNISGGGFSTSGGVSASGNVSAGATVSGVNVSASGAVSGNTGTFNGGLFSTAAYSTVVSGTRTATWTQNDGTVGTAPSSIRFKTNVVLADWSEARVLAVLSASSKYYNYKSEVARRDDPKSPDYVGPDYHVHQEIGYIAEELHAAGLWEFVVYERDLVTKAEARPTLAETIRMPVQATDLAAVDELVYVIAGDSLRLNESGQPIPLGVHYELLGIAAIEAAKWLWGRVQTLESDVANIKARLGI
jgi:hypothetical protein